MSFRQVKSFDLFEYDFEDIEIQNYEKLAEESALLKEIFHDIKDIVNQGDIPLEEIEIKTENCISHTIKGNQSLINAAKSNKAKNTVVLVITASLVGACVGGPIGVGAAVGLSTAVIGFTTLSSILSGAVIGAVTGAGTAGGISGLFYRVLHL